LLLAEGYTKAETAEQCHITERTLYRWARDLDFATEIDRLTFLTGIARRAERLRLAMRVVRQRVRNGKIETDKDLLDWVKFAQSETDGAKLDITALFENVAQAAGINLDESAQHGEAESASEATPDQS